jgi:hypothetical protein
VRTVAWFIFAWGVILMAVGLESLVTGEFRTTYFRVRRDCFSHYPCCCGGDSDVGADRSQMEREARDPLATHNVERWASHTVHRRCSSFGQRIDRHARSHSGE